MLVAPLMLLTPAPAGADTLFPMTRERSVERAFEITGCAATSELAVTAPRGASRVSALRPTVGSDILDATVGEIFARVRARSAPAGPCASRPRASTRPAVLRFGLRG